ncbi:Proton-dependent oligopeptide transporter family [Corchorus capsularis]|uniref:Proton-dependent oligopeptide transporter family n=1 Tax=Corchorus capsularis TaxID=210143 RepID=A0A1R3JFC3_COCAP|nr:Proton-dependent oligopeptide transporter family [Corchorus capsularis]
MNSEYGSNSLNDLSFSLSISPLSTLLRALVAAVRKRRLNYQGNSELLHHDDGEEKLTLTNHLEWLNKAAVKSLADDNLMPDIKRWRLCTVKEVEQTKLLLSIIPMSLTFIVYGMVKSLGNTLFILQIDYMKGGIPFVVFQLIQEVSKHVVNSIYKMVFEKRIERNKRRYSDGVKIGIGMLASVPCCAVAYAVETKRWLNKAAVKDQSKADCDLMVEEKRWRLWTVREVEQTKLLLNIIPMSLTFVTYGMVKSLGNTFFIEQANGMSGGVPVVVFQIIQESSNIAATAGYKMVFERRIKRTKGRYSDGVKIGLGKPEEEEETPFLEVQEEPPSLQVEEGKTSEDQQIQIQLQKIPVHS